MGRVARLVVYAASAAIALVGCPRRASEPTSLTVVAIDRAPPPEAGAWTAKTLATKSTGDPAHVAAVAAVLREAEAKTVIRCTFLEGGEPAGLRFELSSKERLWVFGSRGVAQSSECHEIDAAGQAKLRAVAAALGVTDPRDAGDP